MRIVLVSKFYSEKMGYSDFFLSMALARQGHEVHLIASEYQLQEVFYTGSYEDFLGPRKLACGTFPVANFTLHRLPLRTWFGREYLGNLRAKLREIAPDIVLSGESVKLDTFRLLWYRRKLGYVLATEDHVHLSVFPPAHGPMSLLLRLKFALFRRTAARWLNRNICHWYPIAPDSAEIMLRFFGLEPQKMIMAPLGSDCVWFHPAATAEENSARATRRAELNLGENTVLCVYTGRFSSGKNPLVLAEAIGQLRAAGHDFQGLFVGDGPQHDAIAAIAGCHIRPFVTVRELPEIYRIADIGVWPQQESTSQLDAMATALPIVISDRVEAAERHEGNGETYHQPEAASMAAALLRLADPEVRRVKGACGREKVLRTLDWNRLAAERIREFEAALAASRGGA